MTKFKWFLYIVHFKKPYKGVSHYVGISQDPVKRFQNHIRGRGSRLIKAAAQASRPSDFVLSVIGCYCGGPAARTAERLLKKQKNTKRRCPICKEEKQ